MLVFVESEEWYPVLEIEPVNAELMDINNPYYRPIDIPLDLYNRYEEAYSNFKNVQMELKNIYYHNKGV